MQCMANADKYQIAFGFFFNFFFFFLNHNVQMGSVLVTLLQTAELLSLQDTEYNKRPHALLVSRFPT